jgi:adenosylmethionine-8-amino-7-oxononanoate aminotransferase
VAGFIAEPVGGATLGAIVPPPGYWPLIRSICDRFGLLLIADEVLTGFGRTGTWFALSQFGVEPDVMTMAKGAAGGYFPLSITAMRGEDVGLIRQIHGDFNHGGTFSHHAVGAAAGLATLDILEQNDLVDRAASMGTTLGQALRAELGVVSSVGDIRGLGMMWAVEFVSDRETKAPYPAESHFADRVCATCREMGVLFYPGHGSVDGTRGDHLMVAPPYTVSEQEMRAIVNTLRQGVEQVERSRDRRDHPA